MPCAWAFLLSLGAGNSELAKRVFSRFRSGCHTAAMSNVSTALPYPVELLSPAGDWECVRAAIENGADAIYFGLDCGFNARHRAQNFGLDDLPALGRTLRTRGVRGYVTMNTLVFPEEMPPLVKVVESIAEAGIDAVLVQDFGVAKLVRAICPELEIHASTQMSLTSAETIAVASDLGLSRVVLARELSVQEIHKIAEATTMPLEVFIHGALCVAYSGQCLTSESLGGRSANRGQCAQACRLPYELMCDGEDRDLDDVRYLLSPQDLAGYAAIPDLIDAGVMSLKIEGRLKTPEYVANITRHYRDAIDKAMARQPVTVSTEAKREMELSFSRGFSPGWLEGNDHKRLVPGRHSAKRGVELGQVRSIQDHRIQVRLKCPIALGDGLAIHANSPEGSSDVQGGRVYSLHDGDGAKQQAIGENQVAWIGFGRGEIVWTTVEPGASVFKNDDPKLNRKLRQSFTGADPIRRQPIRIDVEAIVGEPLLVRFAFKDDKQVEVRGPAPLEPARSRPITEEVLREKLGRLGGTSFELGELEARIDGSPMVPMAMLNQLRRQAVSDLSDLLAAPSVRQVRVEAGEELLAPITEERPEPSEPKLAVLCRDLSQLKVACERQVDLIYADFHDIREYSEAVKLARGCDAKIGLASVRMQKPGESGLLRVLERHQPDLILARNLAALDRYARSGIQTVADFSLNVANHRAAEWVRSLGADRVTASYDLNRDQIIGLVESVPSSWIETVIHQHMPMFHMEHCVFCSVLSPGTNKTNCGRPCDHHKVALRDRVGSEHPLHADVACRNTLYNATPQSGAELVSELIRQGVCWFRIEFVEETSKEASRVIGLYRDLLTGRVDGRDVWMSLKAANRVGVTRGTLETKRNPLAIL